jgi:hypothetical protein
MTGVQLIEIALMVSTHILYLNLKTYKNCKQSQNQ